MAFAQRIITQIQDQDDFTDTTGAGTDQYSVTWDNGTSKFVLTDRQDAAIDHGSIGGLSDDDHTQYLLSDGSRIGGTGQEQQFTNGVITEWIQPISDSTLAFGFYDAAGSVPILTVDSTNYIVRITRNTHNDNFLLGSAGNTTLSGSSVVAMGTGAGAALTSGDLVVAIGRDAGKSSTTGGTWLALGARSGFSNIGGGSWAAVGYQAGYSNTTGTAWTAIGREAGFTNVGGNNWTAVGFHAAYLNSSGADFTAIGREAAYTNASGSSFTAVGYQAGYSSTTASFWTAIGNFAAYSHTTNNTFTAIGHRAGYSCSSGSAFVAVGHRAGEGNVSGSNWVAIGRDAGQNYTGASGVMLGYQAGQNETTSNRLHIANTSSKSLLLGDFNANTLMIGDTALTAPTAAADLAASTSSRASLRIRSGTAPTSPNDGDMWKLSDTFAMFATDATTSAVVNTLRLRRSSTGTPANGFGSAINAQLASSTTAGQDAGRIRWSWIDATHASRASRADFGTYYTTTERTSLSIGSNNSAALLSFFNSTLVIQQAATGETTGFTAGAGTSVNDDSTFTGNVGSTAYRISDIVKALKNYGLLAA